MPKNKGGHKSRKAVTPFATRLLRTISIHHVGSDVDHGRHPNHEVLLEAGSQLRQDPPLLRRSSDPSTAESTRGEVVNKGKRYCDACGTPATADPGGGGGHVCHKKRDKIGYQLLEKQALLRENLREAKASLLGQQEGADEELQENYVARRHSCDILEALELLNANNELFLRLLREPDSDMITGADSQGQEDSKGGRNIGRTLTRRGSFPGAESSSRKGTSFKLRDDVLLTPKKLESSPKAEKLQSLPEIGNPEGDNKSQFVVDTPSPTAPSVRGISEITAPSSEPASSSFAQVVNRERDRGSAAACRFKVIKQRIKGIIKDNKKEMRRIAMDGVLHKVPVDGESSRLSFGSDLGVSNYSTGRVSFSGVPRSQSLSESAEKYAHLLESTSRREPNYKPPVVSERLKLANHKDGGSQAPRSTFGRIFSLPEFEACFRKDDRNEASLDLSLSKPGSVLDPAEGNEEEEEEEEEEGEEEEEEESMDEQKLASVVDDETDAASGAVITEDVSSALLFDEQVSVPCVEAGDHTPEVPSSTAVVVGSNLAGFPVFPAESSVFQAAAGSDSELEIDQGPDLSDDQQDESDASDSTTIMETDELSNAGSDAQVSGGAPLGFDILPVPLHQHEMEFNYVNDVLKAYLFDSSELSERWSSPNCKPPDPSVPEEVEASAHEPEEPSNMYPQFNLDRELLYDLTNQILIEICGNSYAHTPWISNMWGSHTRPVPVGFHLLKEVWAHISWHLKANSHANPTLEYIMERDFRKNDGWMNLNHDLECVGLDLEAALLDDLIDETLFEVLDWDYV